MNDWSHKMPLLYSKYHQNCQKRVLRSTISLSSTSKFNPKMLLVKFVEYASVRTKITSWSLPDNWVAPWGTPWVSLGHLEVKSKLVGIRELNNIGCWICFIEDKNHLKVTTGPPNCPLKHPWGTRGVTRGQNKTWSNQKILLMQIVTYALVITEMNSWSTLVLWSTHGLILWFIQVLFWPWVAPGVPHGCFRGQLGGPVVTLRLFLSSM